MTDHLQGYRPLFVHGRDLYYLQDCAFNPRLPQELDRACAKALYGNIPIRLHQVQEIKGRLNEKQYAARLPTLAGKPLQMKALMREQNAYRCQYANAHLLLKYFLPRDKDELQELAAVILTVAAAAQSMNVDEPEREAIIGNCLVARELLVSRQEMVARIEKELANDATFGRARQALHEAFNELHLPAADRKTLMRIDDLVVINPLPNYWMQTMVRQYHVVRNQLRHAQTALADLRKMRGMLHEEQFVRQLETAAGDGTETVTILDRQNKRRRCFNSYRSHLAYFATQLSQSVEELRKALAEAMGVHQIFTDRPDVVDAMKSNCIAAQTLVEEICEKHLPAFTSELANDPTDGQAAQSFVDALRDLLADEALAKAAIPLPKPPQRYGPNRTLTPGGTE